MVAMVKKRLQIRKSLNEILQILSVNIFAQEPMEELLATTPGVAEQKVEEANTQKLLILQG